MSKRIVSMLLTMLLVLTAFAGCQKTPTAATPSEGTEATAAPAETEATAPAEPAVYSELYGSEVASLNYLIEGATWEQQVAANVIDTLVEYDSHANLIPGLAETWECSADGLTWTFHLRQGVKWYDYTGKEIAEVTAQNFVDAAKYVCDPKNESGTDYMILDLIAGASDYYDQVSAYYDTLGEGVEGFAKDSGADFSIVGVKAVDDYTLTYTTVDIYPFFPTCLTYVCYMPAYGPQLDELGLAFGTDNTKLYYCGSFILTEFEPQVKHIYEKNVNNWDAEHVYIDRIERLYNAESTTLAPTMVLRGEIGYADIPNSIVDEWKANYPQYLSKDRAVPDYSYFYCFNFRPAEGNAERLKIWKDSGWEPDNWQKAVANANFRHAIMSAFNRDYSMYALEPDADARKEVTQRSITPRTFTSVDGTDYSVLPQFANVDQYFFNEAKAQEYKTAAIADFKASGVKLPVKVVLGYRSDQSDWENEVVLLKQQLESVLGTDFIECVLYAGPAESFLTQVRRNGMYGFMRCNWGADYEDPSTWTAPFAADDSVTDGIYKGNSYNDMDYCLFEGSENEMTELMRAYYAKVEEAKKIPETAPRYAAFAEAEAMLIENAVVIPYYIAPAFFIASKLDIFEGEYAPCGVSNLRFKYQKLHENYITLEEYEQNYAEWLTAMGIK